MFNYFFTFSCSVLPFTLAFIAGQSPNSETVPREKMYRITTMYPEDPRAPFYAPGGHLAPLARLHLSREAILPRSCDEQVLLSQVTEEAENTQSVNRREFALSPGTSTSFVRVVGRWRLAHPATSVNVTCLERFVMSAQRAGSRER